MTTEYKDIYDAIIAGNKSLDGAFRLYIAAKYMTEDPALKMELVELLRDLINVEERAISLLMRLNNEV